MGPFVHPFVPHSLKCHYRYFTTNTQVYDGHVRRQPAAVQEDSIRITRWFRKVQEGSKGSRKFKKDQEGSRRFKKAQWVQED